MNRLRVLGIGSNALEKLDTTAFLVDLSDGNQLLVDCGPNTPRRVLESGVTLRDVTVLLLTHSHMDHTLGVPYLLFGRNLEIQAASKQDPTYAATSLKVIADSNLWSTCRETFCALHPEVKLAFDIEHREIDELRSGLKIDGADLFAVEADHAVKTYSLVFKEGGETFLAYSSDTLPTRGFMEAARGARVLIHEGMVPKSESGFSSATKHATAEQAGEVTAAVQPSVAYMVHLRPSFYEDRGALEAEATSAAGMSVTYPTEGQLIDLR